MRPANLALSFLLELACFAALGYAGAVIGAGIWAAVLAVLLPAAAIAVWARWNAPRSAHRLPTRRRVPAELAVFAAAAILLAVAGAPVWAAVFALLVVANTVLLTVFDQSGIDQRGIDQRGIDQRGIDQRGIDQRGIDQRGIDQWEA